MPLEHSKSDEARSRNIAEMIRAGHDPKQAEAAAYRIQREASDARAAGVMLRAPSGRMLFMKRSDKAQDHPGEWCCPGGSIEAGETPHDAMLRELQEETMYGPVEGAESIDERDGFQTFRADVKEEFTPTLNEEHTEFRWAPMDSPPHPLHPGVAATLKKLAGESRALDRREYDTNNWYEVLDNPLSKVGVYQYSGRSIGGDADPKKMYGVFRPPEELGSEETVKSFRLMPWTDDHPNALLGPREQGLVPAEEKGVHGVIGEKTYFRADRPEDEDGTLYGNLKIFSESLRQKVPGKRELSCGYHCQFIRQDGVYKGEPYQYVQRNLRGNHVASVDQGRMGSSVRVLDSAERLTFALDLKEIPAMPEIRKDEAEGTVDADTLEFIGKQVGDSFNSLVGELERKGYSKEYATKIAGKVAAEKGMTGHHDSTDSIGAKSMSGTAADATTETKTEEERKKEAADRRAARDSKRGARDSRRAKDEMTEEESEAEDAAECAEDAEEEKEDEKDDSKEARDRKSARDRRAGARDARKMARDRARDKAAKDAARDKAKGMDASEITALVQRESAAAADKAATAAAASARRDTRAADRLYQRLSPLVGAFDHDEMSHAEMAAYGLKKLGQAESKDPVTALDYFLAGRAQSQPEPRVRGGAAHDASDESFVGKYLNS